MSLAALCKDDGEGKGKSTRAFVLGLRRLGYTQAFVSILGVILSCVFGWQLYADEGYMWINAVNVVVAVVGLLASFMFLSCAFAVSGADSRAVESKLKGAGFWVDPKLKTFAGLPVSISLRLASFLLFIKLVWFAVEIGVMAGLLKEDASGYASPIAFTVIYALYLVVCFVLWKFMLTLHKQYAEYFGADADAPDGKAPHFG